MVRFFILVLICLFAACSSKTTKTEETVVTQPPKQTEPVCLPGCAINVEDKCVTLANVSDGAQVETQEIPCEPSCCSAKVVDSGNDPDGDGLAGDADQCPTEAEDFDDFQDKDGCPDPDNDQDGILDADDLCAEDAEDIDGFQDRDGCPRLVDCFD